MIDRISKNEERLDNTISCINELKTSLEKFKSNKNNLSLLKKYYGSKNWFKDKDVYEKNSLSIKAGVLSEDAVWNMLDDLDELINDMKEVITDFEGDNMERPKLDKNLDSKIFKDFYYLKEELVDFCRSNGLQTTGSKSELTERIIKYLDTGEKTIKKSDSRRTKIISEITMDTLIEENFVCSEKHREFYKKNIGNSFSFNVLFQKWLKNNTGKTYKDSIDAYYKILEDKKNNKTSIDKQFEYNTYIRDFFNDNKDKSLNDAIKCWKYKKSLKGHNKYEKDDLIILNDV